MARLLAWLLCCTTMARAAQLMLGDNDGHVQYTPAAQLDLDACQDRTNATCDGRW